MTTEQMTCFCEQLCREYEADPERGQFVTLGAAALACGVALTDDEDKKMG